MLKKLIKFEDLDGNPCEEEFYFGVNKAELTKLHLTLGEDMAGLIRQLIAEQERAKIVDLFEKVIKMSIGKKSEDGKRFLKSDEITENFCATDAYSELFMELVTDTAKMAEFIRGIMPNSMATEVAKMDLENVDLDTVIKGYEENAAKAELPPADKKLEEYTETELLEMPQDQFDKLVGKDPKKWPHAVLQVAFQRKTAG